MHGLRSTRRPSSGSLVLAVAPVIATALDWLGRLTAYGWIDLGSDLLLLAMGVTGLRWLHQVRATTRALLHSETYGHHAPERGPA